VDDVDLVVARELLRVLGVERDVGLGVVLDDLDLAAEESPGGVDLLGRELRGEHHRLPVRVEVAGVVEHRAELDRRALRERAREGKGGRRRGAGRRDEQVTTREGHGLLLRWRRMAG